MKKVLALCAFALPLFLAAHFANAETLKSKDKLLTLFNPGTSDTTAIPSVTLNINSCPAKKKCTKITYRLLTSELNEKNKVIAKGYTDAKTVPETLYLDSPKANTKYSVSLEQKSGKKWLAIHNSKITFKTKDATTAPVTFNTQTGAAPLKVSETKSTSQNMPTVVTQQLAQTQTPSVPFVPIKATAFPLSNTKLYKNQQGQQLYYARLTTPSNRDITITKVVIHVPKEIKTQNAVLYFGSYPYASLIDSAGQDLMVFNGNLKIAANQSFFISLYGSIPADVPTGSGSSMLAGIATSESGSYYERLDLGGAEPKCDFTINEVVQAQQQQPASQLYDLGDGLKLQYIQVGTGTTVESGKQVAVHYVGTLEDGTKFDSSVDRGQPFVFTVGSGQVIQGWDRGLNGRKVGDQFRLYIPAALGYGAAGAGASIPPNSNLVFDIAVLATQ